jgi:mannosyltransferase
MTRLGPRRLRLALAALVAVGALLRFATLGAQHFWQDEAVTAALLRLDLRDMLATMSAAESTPPLYYLVAWAWVLVFGTGEVGLRALSAVAGTLTIPVAYAMTATLTSRETGLVAAALTAVNPGLVWYSQEARSYALLVLLGGLSVLFFARSLRGGGDRDVALWAVAAVLSLLTHYFAGFLVAAEALWLLAAYPKRTVAALAVGSVAASCAALLPLVVRQSGQLGFIEESPLRIRVAEIGEQFLVGPTGEAVEFGLPVIAALALGAIALLLRTDTRQRRSILVPASLALAAVSAPIVLAAVGMDYVLARNFLLFWLPAVVVVAVGLSARRSPRIGAAVGIALVVGSMCLAVAVPLDRSLQREAVAATLIKPERLDPQTQRIAPRIAYAVPADGEPLQGTAVCPEGYSASSGGGYWLSKGAHEALPESSLSDGPQGWTATARSEESRGRTLWVYSVCVRPID